MSSMLATAVVEAGVDTIADIANERVCRQEDPPDTVPLFASNGLGLWLWHIERTGFTHEALAAKLEELGVGRVLIKVGEGSADCDAWPELCDAGMVDRYRAHGLEVFAWSFQHPGHEAAQAAILSRAAQTGYDGMVVDIEADFDGSVAGLTRLMAADRAAVDAAIVAGIAPPGWPFEVTTWGNPADHDLHVDIIDRYADAHLPQVYIAEWGDTSDPAASVRSAICEYRALGAQGPVNPIVSNESGGLDADGLNAFIEAAGPEASVWRVPDARESRRWRELEAIDWSRTTFDPPPDCP